MRGGRVCKGCLGIRDFDCYKGGSKLCIFCKGIKEKRNMILFNFDNSDIFCTCVIYNVETMPSFVHPLAKMLSAMTKREAIEYIKTRGWSYKSYG